MTIFEEEPFYTGGTKMHLREGVSFWYFVPNHFHFVFLDHALRYFVDWEKGDGTFSCTFF